MYRVAHEIGRLVEIAIWTPVSIAETERWGADHDRVIEGVGQPYVCFVDLRGAKLFPQEVVEAYVSTMRAEQQLVRTATLLPESPLVALQIGRMIRQAGHPQRRAFELADEATAWLSEVLDPRERARLRSIVDAPVWRQT
ncbi:hypothetical protein ACNOYE_06930 [Nannocystaceae bacterium ST9]